MEQITRFANEAAVNVLRLTHVKEQGRKKKRGEKTTKKHKQVNSYRLRKENSFLKVVGKRVKRYKNGGRKQGNRWRKNLMRK